MNYAYPPITKIALFSLVRVKEFQDMSDLPSIESRVTMNQVTKISTQIEGYFCDTNPELNFLFDSLLLSLRTASKNAGSSAILRSVPSIRHAKNLSSLLETALLRLPIPSLHGHIKDLFEYFQRTLEENSQIPIYGELDELSQLTVELRKGINSLSESKAEEPASAVDVEPAKPHLLSS